MPNPAPWRQASDELAELRRLLDIPDSVEWAELRSFWNSREHRARDLGERLPEAIRLRGQPDAQLRDALQPAIEDGLRISVRRNPQVITEALFPLIGAMVRRAVAASLAQLNESVNQTLESSLSVRSLAWRWEASRRGVPFSRVLLERSLRFRVDQAFLIDRRTGLLLLHRSSPGAAVKDPAVISGMLTAIQDFVQDSFSGPEDMLESVRMGDFTVWISSGPRAILTCVVHGACPPSFKTVMEDSIGAIHQDFAPALEEFEGDSARFTAAAPVLDACLLGKASPQKSGIQAIWVIAALLLLAIVFGGFLYWNQGRRYDRFTAQLRTQPGIVITSAQRSGGKWTINGLRDPMALDPVTLAAPAQIDPSRLQLNLQPFLAPAFASQRAALEASARIQRRVLRFDTGSAALPGAVIGFLADDISQLADLARRANQPLLIHVIGSTDTAGADTVNVPLGQQRAQNVVAALTALGLPSTLFDTRVQTSAGRNVNFEVEMGGSGNAK